MVQICRCICLLSCLIITNLCAQETRATQKPGTGKQDSAQVSLSGTDSTNPAVPATELTAQRPSGEGTVTVGNLIAFSAVLVALATLLFSIYVRRKSVRHAAEIERARREVEAEYEKKLEQVRLEQIKKEELARLEAVAERAQTEQKQKTKTAEQRYRDALGEELGSIKILGSPDIESVPVNLLDAFVSLDLSETWRSEGRFDPRKLDPQATEEKYSTPEIVLRRAFKNYRMLLLIGDPGSGKTTLMKYYAISCVRGDGYKKFDLKAPVLPLYLPLRELEFKDGTPNSLPENLAKWANNHVLNISAEEFHNWLHQGPTLVLLDGLDEISDLEQRKRVCEWIDNTCAGLKKTKFVVTSRWTGYRKVDGIELGFDHMRADVRDF